MRNLFKKSLTLCLVAILAFSCFAGIVSAENSFTATIAVENQTITPGTTSVDVVLDITSSQIGINEALIEVSSDIGTIGSKAELVSSTGAASIQMHEGSTNYGSFYLSAENDISGETTVLGSVTAAKIKVTFTVAEDKAVGTYPINIKVDGVRAASSDEDVITFSYATANVTIAEPHVHEYTYTPNGDKTHNGACACNEAPITNEACVDGDDEDTLCDKCGGETAEAVVPDDVLFRVKNASMVLEGEILMNFNVMPYDASATSVCTTFDIEGVKEFGILVWLPEEYDENNIAYDASHAYPYTDGPITADGYGVRFPLNSKQLNVELHVRGYVILDNDTIIYGKATNGTDQVITYSAVQYSQNMLGKTSTRAEIKDVLKSMLNYGAAAEIYFATRAGETIPTTEELPNYILDEADRVVPTAEFADDVWAGQTEDGNESVQVSSSRIKNSSLMLDEAVYLNYTVDLTTETEKTIANVKVLSWNEEDYAEAVANGGALLGTETLLNDCTLESEKIYRGKSFGVASNKLRADVRARAYVEYTDGTVGYTRIFTYSAEYHAKSQIAKSDTAVIPTLKSLLNALMIYADKAIVAFG